MRRYLTLSFAMLVILAMIGCEKRPENARDKDTTLEAALAKYHNAINVNTAESWVDSAQTAKDLMNDSQNYLTRCAASQLYLNSYCELSTDYEQILKLNAETAKLKSLVNKGECYNAVDTNPDNTRLLLLNTDSVCVYDTADMSLVARSKSSYKPSTGARFSKDGKYIYFAQSSAIAVLNAETCEQIGVLRGIEGDDCFLDITPDGKYLVATDIDKSLLCVFNLSVGSCLYRNTCSKKWSRRMKISPDSRYISYTNQKSVELREIATNNLLRTYPDTEYGAFSPDGRLFFAKSEILDLKTMSIIINLNIPEGVSFEDAAFSSDSSLLFLLSSAKCAVFSSRTGDKIKDVTLRNIEYIRQVIPVYSQGLIAIFCTSGLHSLLSASTGEYVGILSPDESKCCVAVSQNEQFLFTFDRSEMQIVFLPAFRKPISEFLSNVLREGTYCFTNLLAPALNAVRNGEVERALELAQNGVIEIFRLGDRLSIVAAVDSLRAVARLAGYENPSLYSEGIDDIISISTNGQPVIGVGYRGDSIGYATNSMIKFDPPIDKRTSSIEIKVPEGNDVFFSNWSIAVIAPTDMGCRIVFRGCHNSEFSFATSNSISGVSFFNNGSKAILFTDKEFIAANLWRSDLCSVFTMEGANESNVLIHDDSVVLSRAKFISFHVYCDNTVYNEPDLNPEAFFSIPNPFSTDFSAIHCNTERSLLAACSSSGEVGVWDVYFGNWRGKMPDCPESRPSYDPDKGKIPLHKFETGVSNASIIRCFFYENNGYIAVFSEKTGEYSIHSYPDGKQLHKGRTLQGKIYALASPQTNKGNQNKETQLPSPIYFVARAENSFGAVDMVTGKSATFDVVDNIRSVRLSPDGAFLVYGTDSGFVKPIYLPALFVR